MTSYDFRLLPVRQQVKALYHNGVFIGKQLANNETVVLYQLEGFYVEIRYRKYRYYIHSISVFTNINKVNPYLKAISLVELIGW
jgi:hypothetical protein